MVMDVMPISDMVKLPPDAIEILTSKFATTAELLPRGQFVLGSFF